MGSRLVLSSTELVSWLVDLLCVLVVRVLYCKPRGLRFDSWRYQILREIVGLERTS
jgi:hypothetical protein